MKDLAKAIRKSLRDPEYAEAYAESFQDSYLATQIKVLREQRAKSQAELGEMIGTTQGGISRIEDASYSSWSVKTLKKLAKAFGLRLRISFEEYGTLPAEVVTMTKGSLMKFPHEDDLGLFPEKSPPANQSASFLLRNDIHAARSLPELQARQNDYEIGQFSSERMMATAISSAYGGESCPIQ